MKKVLVIQTAFIGDAILATSFIETLKDEKLKIHLLVRKGNEALFTDHPFIDKLLVWDKQNKYSSLFEIIKKVRKENYEMVYNLQRFFSTGLITALSNAKKKIGFDKNPLSFFYTKKVIHTWNTGDHEIKRNTSLIDSTITPKPPKLYFSQKIQDKVSQYTDNSYVCMAPTSVWYTKQLPKEKWVELINNVPSHISVYLLGGKGDFERCDQIKESSNKSHIINLCGKFSLLESAAIMKNAKQNFVNDSAPLHLCSATNAPVTAFFCSTIPNFGFGPLSTNSKIIETIENLTCRPCGMHGHKECPEKHFKCGKSIDLNEIIF